MSLNSSKISAYRPAKRGRLAESAADERELLSVGEPLIVDVWARRTEFFALPDDRCSIYAADSLWRPLRRISPPMQAEIPSRNAEPYHDSAA